jgi:hypothetical protein
MDRQEKSYPNYQCRFTGGSPGTHIIHDDTSMSPSRPPKITLERRDLGCRRLLRYCILRLHYVGSLFFRSPSRRIQRQRQSSRPSPAPEFRALRQILAEAAQRGEQVFILGPAGVIEISPPEMPGREFMTPN